MAGLNIRVESEEAKEGAQSESKTEKKIKKSRKPILPRLNKKALKTWAVLIVLLAVTIGGAVLWTRYNNLKKENARLANPEQATKDEANKLKAEVGEFVELPTNETPTIATVVDASKLKNQPFFLNAQNGDKVLMFAQAKKAILYRPTTKKVIEIAPINIGNGQSSEETTTDSSSQN